MNITQAVILSFALALPMGAVAGDPDKKKEHTEKMIEALQLDDSRAEQVREIMKSHYEQRKQVKEQAHEQMKTLKEQKQERLEAVLTDDEMEQLKEMREAKKEKYKKKSKHHKIEDKD